MATQLIFPIVKGSDSLACGVTQTVAGTSVATFTVNPNTLFRIVTTGAIVAVRFGDSSINTATINDLFVLPSIPEIFDSGNATTIAVYNISNISTSVNVVLLARS